MFGELLESRARKDRRGKVAAASAAAHAVMVLTVAVATKSAVARPPDETPPRDTIYWSRVSDPPEPRPGPRAPGTPRRVDAAPAPPLPPVDIPPELPPIDVPLGPPTRLGLTDALEPGPGAPGAPDGGAPAARGDSVYGPASLLVDRPAGLEPGGAQPRYPEMLRRAGVTGRVVVRFVVDTAGRVEPGSVRVVESDHELFAQAVRAALPRLRFAPAEAGGRRVRQLVEMPFEFTLER